MILLSSFLEVLFRAFIFIGLALSVGGIVFYYVVLRPMDADDLTNATRRRTILLIGIGAFLVAISQFLTLVITPWALADAAGHWPLAAFLTTGFAKVGILYTALGFCLGCVVIYLWHHPKSSVTWLVAAFVAVMITVSGAWFTHGASRIENAAALMTVTVIHQLAAVVWIGGTMHLTAQWRLLHRIPNGDAAWLPMPARFSPLALCSVVFLIIAGVYLYWQYIYSVSGLIGTAYGTMLITKVALMAVVLLLGGINNLTIRHWKVTGDGEGLLRRLPVFAEIEAGIGAIILMVAAALTDQPPSVDVLDGRASPMEVLRVFAPKIPQLTPAPFAKMLAHASSSLDPYSLPTALQKIQSNFNHNISGIFVIIVALGAFIYRFTGARWARHWPLLFLPFALFLLIFGEPNGWPLGNEGFWNTLAAPEVLVHRLSTLFVVGLAIFEWRVRAGGLAATRWRYVFPLLCVIGGVLLLTHSHSLFAIKSAFLIEGSHNAIGVLAVLMGAGRWLELRMSGQESRIAGIIWPICFMLIGFVLLFYRET